MRQILETEDRGRKGRPLSWPEARTEWKAHREQYEKFLVETLSFPNLVPTTPFAKEGNLFTEEAVVELVPRYQRRPTEVNDLRLKSWACE